MVVTTILLLLFAFFFSTGFYTGFRYSADTRPLSSLMGSDPEGMEIPPRQHFDGYF